MTHQGCIESVHTQAAATTTGVGVIQAPPDSSNAADDLSDLELAAEEQVLELQLKLAQVRHQRIKRQRLARATAAPNASIMPESDLAASSTSFPPAPATADADSSAAAGFPDRAVAASVPTEALPEEAFDTSVSPVVSCSAAWTSSVIAASAERPALPQLANAAAASPLSELSTVACTAAVSALRPPPADAVAPPPDDQPLYRDAAAGVKTEAASDLQQPSNAAAEEQRRPESEARSISGALESPLPCAPSVESGQSHIDQRGWGSFPGPIPAGADADTALEAADRGNRSTSAEAFGQKPLPSVLAPSPHPSSIEPEGEGEWHAQGPAGMEALLFASERELQRHANTAAEEADAFESDDGTAGLDEWELAERRRGALREAAAEGLELKGSSTSTTGYRGVYLTGYSTKANGVPYWAAIVVYGRQVHLGRFATPEEGALAYARALKKHFRSGCKSGGDAAAKPRLQRAADKTISHSLRMQRDTRSNDPKPVPQSYPGPKALLRSNDQKLNLVRSNGQKHVPHIKPRGKDLVDKRVRVYWEGDGVWYHGRVRDYDSVPDMHWVHYDDGEVRSHHLNHKRSRWQLEAKAVADSLVRVHPARPPAEEAVLSCMSSLQAEVKEAGGRQKLLTGWGVRPVAKRTSGQDVIEYFSPDGHRFRSRLAVLRHLGLHP